MTGPWLAAVDELLRRKLRSMLTLLGIILGTAAIVSMLGIGEGSRREALKLVQSLGVQNLLVDDGSAREDSNALTTLGRTGLTIADMNAAARATPDVEAVSAFKRIQTWGVYSRDLPADVNVAAVSPNYFPLVSLTIASGKLFSRVDDQLEEPLAVLGSRAASTLFPSEDAIGRLVKINHVPVRVIGVLHDRDAYKDQFQGVSVKDDSNTIFLPISTGVARFRFPDGQGEVDRLYLKVGSMEAIARAAASVSRSLIARHNGIADFSLIVPLQLFNQSQKTQKIFDIVMVSIAAICLIVGGIGIMNIMLANVLERKREIGLFRAMGASRSDITRQFLREALVVSCAGVILGALLGVGTAYVVAYLSGWVVGWSVLAVILSCFTCVMIGAGFGVYPAMQAAALDPISAIRDE
jgi:putative ABC transport system permease protein